MVGDSKLVASWRTIDWGSFWQRCDWENWTRHVEREFNKDCDAQATADKMLVQEAYNLTVYDNLSAYV